MAKRNLTQIRPKGGDGPVYSPNRDLAYIYAPAMREALYALDEVNWQGDIKSLIEQLGVTEEDIGRTVEALTKAHTMFVNDPTVHSAVDALTVAGYYDCPAAARYLIHGRIGEVLLGGFFIALRDTSELGKESAQQREIADIVAAGKEVAARSSGEVGTPGEMSELRQQLNAVHSELEQSRAALEAAHGRREQEVAAQQALRNAAHAEIGVVRKELSEALERANDYNMRLIEIYGQGFWKGIVCAISRWWRGGSKALASPPTTSKTSNT